MNKVCGIYKIVSPSGKVYIGQSVNISHRWRQHKSSVNGKRDSALCRSLRKYGIENHEFLILEECGADELNVREKFYTDQYNSFSSSSGLNSRDGGGSKGTFSDELKARLSAAHVGKPSPKKGKKTNKPAWNSGTKGVCKAWNKGKTNIYSPEHIKKMRDSKLGIPVPESRKIQISRALKGRTFSGQHKQRLSNAAINRYKKA